MMLRKMIFATGLVLALAAGPAAAQPAEIAVVSTARVSLRAGPATSYPLVDALPAGSRLVLHGCLAGYAWCDVSWGADRGWLSAAYLHAIYRDAPIAITAMAAARLGIRIIAFDSLYWRRYRVGRPLYRRWRYRPLW
jgi:uncharacterized protein YraI